MKDWRPAPLTMCNRWIITGSLTAAMLARGLDYLVKPEPPPVMVAAFPAYVWGLWFMLGGIVLAAGMATRTHRAVWVGHMTAVIAYTALLVGLTTNLDPVWRNTTALVPALVMHVMFLLRTGARPRHD